MPPAIIAAGVAATATIGGAVMSSKAQKKAAAKAAATAQSTADSNNALAREQYTKNEAVLAPFQQRGNVAGDAINSLLGLGQQGVAQGGAGTNYNQAFQKYQDSTGYQFRTNEGVRALDAAASAGGVRNSGAAQKSLAQYGQNIASSEFGNYLSQLANQQGVGLAGASAQAGVGQNYVNNVTANNNSAGTAAANAQLFRGQSTANMWGQVGGALGKFGSSF